MRARKLTGKLEPGNSVEENDPCLSTPDRLGPIPVSHSKTDSSRDHLPKIEIDFAELQDGSLAEIIEHPAEPTKSLLAVYKDGIAQYAEQWPDRNRIVVPLSRADSLLEHVRLPRGAEPYAELAELEKDVLSFFAFCLDVDGMAGNFPLAAGADYNLQGLLERGDCLWRHNGHMGV
jgi:hypothetical protein